MYDFRTIEKKWQKIWEEKKPWRAHNPNSHRKKSAKCFNLIEFPYPSGEGLHVGHVRSYTAMDVISRKRRMEGYNVLYPIGWDAFGLPTEQYAIKTGVSPEEVTQKNTTIFRKQLKSLGFSFDWDREINTTDPDYYKWTQWIFIQFFKHGLAYKDTAYVNWCPSCRIGLANEEVINGHCERCRGEVEKKMRKQWMLRITAYADKLLEGLDLVDYPQSVKLQQVNWIGRSEGREIEFKIYPNKGRKAISQVKVFTTRPDTIDGATYLVLAPEHPLITELLENKSLKSKIKNAKAIIKYINQAKKKTDLERQENKDKTGVELQGVKAVNPYNGERLPVWIADYVLAYYGTGAIMAVPRHDERDREFAHKFNLPIIDRPLLPRKKWPGKKKINYKLRDWVFSRQRYWGEPIPIIICSGCGYVPVPEEDLPVKLPKIKDYQPRADGKSPLANAIEWVRVKCPSCGQLAQRETDVMPNWAGSSWYYWAYLINLQARNFQLPEANLKYWLPVDWYNGGMEHTTLHLLYSRFWHHFLYDIGVLPYPEPYKKRTSHGLVLGEGGEKMSKSKGNVVNPDDLAKKFGADSLRLYEMFMGPFGDAIPWDSQGIVGVHRFLNRVYKLGIKVKKEKSVNNRVKDNELEKLLHQTIKKVSQDIEEMKFNTAVSSLMILLNEFDKKSVKSTVPYSYFLTFLKLLFPFAPHLAQELWPEKELLDYESWPQWDPQLVEEETFQLIIQINGKTRAVVTAKKGISKKEAEELAVSIKEIKNRLVNKPVKVIFTGTLINFVL